MTNQPQRPFDYRQTLWQMLSNPLLSLAEADIIDHITSNGFEKKPFARMLERKGYTTGNDLKITCVLFFLRFVRQVLVDRIISEEERTVSGLLKLLFEIDSTDLLPDHLHLVEQIIHSQLNYVKEQEPGIGLHAACDKAGLQELLSLGYDEYVQLCSSL